MNDDEEPLSLYERAQVVRWQLEDATEDLNDSFRGIESALSEKGFKAAEIPIPPFEERRSRVLSGHRLIWNGQRLIYDDGKTRIPLLNAPRAARIRAANALPDLARQLGIADGHVVGVEPIGRP